MNEVLFRKANDRIDESAGEHASPAEEVAFYCECSDRDCTERILITAQEFENVREHDAQFLVRPGHDVPSVEIVVTSTPPRGSNAVPIGGGLGRRAGRS